MPRKRSNKYIWCINGIPEESLLHKNTAMKRRAVSIKWGLVSRFYSPDLVITVSKRMSVYVSSKISQVKTISIPLNVDLDRFQMKRNVERIFYTYSGSGAPWQNLEQLSEVWGSLNQLDPSIRFRVISRDSRARVLGSKVPKEAIEFVGTSDLDELAGYLEQAEFGFLIRQDSLVNRVSFPTKLSEYLASGAWVVSSDIDWDVADLIKKHSVGILVPPSWSSDQIATRILESRTDFIDKERLEKRLTNALKELSKVYWLEEGRKQLLESNIFLK
ncbi:glycosyltransferase [Algoriphagus antarcticus]|nr:glycosyltransferase [Algoriphagus antarcticus]